VGVAPKDCRTPTTANPSGFDDSVSEKNAIRRSLTVVGVVLALAGCATSPLRWTAVSPTEVIGGDEVLIVTKDRAIHVANVSIADGRVRGHVLHAHEGRHRRRSGRAI